MESDLVPCPTAVNKGHGRERWARDDQSPRRAKRQIPSQFLHLSNNISSESDQLCGWFSLISEENTPVSLCNGSK